MTNKEVQTDNSTYPKVTVNWLIHPGIFQGCVSIKDCAWLTVK